jgi:3-oxoacyl-[acyl-carrier protein] reductase
MTRVALVTGGSRGIGRATALRLAEDGCDVAVGYVVQQAAADEVVAELSAIGVRAVAVSGDLAQADAAEQMAAAVEAELGPVEVLVANAGIAGTPKALVDVSDADWERMLAINLGGPFRLVRRLWPGMLERGFGRIVLVSSIAAYTGGLVGPHYAASKAGLHGLAHSLAQQGAAHGVTVNVVAPALVDTDLVPDDARVREALAASAPVGRLGDPREAADLIAAIVRNGYLTGQSIVLDGGRHPT